MRRLDSRGASAFSPDSRTLAVAGTADSAITLDFWDVSDPQSPLRRGGWTRSGSGSFGQAVAYGVTSGTIAVMVDNALDLWDVDPARIAPRLCLDIGDVITRVQWKQYVPNAAYAPPC